MRNSNALSREKNRGSLTHSDNDLVARWHAESQAHINNAQVESLYIFIGPIIFSGIYFFDYSKQL